LLIYRNEIKIERSVNNILEGFNTRHTKVKSVVNRLL